LKHIADLSAFDPRLYLLHIILKLDDALHIKIAAVSLAGTAAAVVHHVSLWTAFFGFHPDATRFGRVLCTAVFASVAQAKPIDG
jgi:hypothetical protein